MKRIRIFVNRGAITLQEGRSSNSRGVDFKKLAKQILDEKSRYLYFEDHQLNDLWTRFSEGFKHIHAAGGLVLNNHKEVLFIHRLGKWDLPKGKIENAETPETCAIREVQEECGINDLKVINTLSTTYHIYPHKGELILKTTHWFSMIHHGHEELIPQTEEDITQVQWKPEKDFNTLMDNSYKNIQLLLSENYNSVKFTL